jgi:hypothetical protein
LLRATLASPDGCIVLGTPFSILFEANVTAPFEIKSITVQLVQVRRHQRALGGKQAHQQEIKAASVHKPGTTRTFVTITMLINCCAM